MIRPVSGTSVDPELSASALPGSPTGGSHIGVVFFNRKPVHFRIFMNIFLMRTALRSIAKRVKISNNKIRLYACFLKRRQPSVRGNDQIKVVPDAPVRKFSRTYDAGRFFHTHFILLLLLPMPCFPPLFQTMPCFLPTPPILLRPRRPCFPLPPPLPAPRPAFPRIQTS